VRHHDQVTVHQLLGRLCYFHTLFIQPALQPAEQSTTGRPCCHHQPVPGPAQPDVADTLHTSAWLVLEEIATTLTGHLQPCPATGKDCCATCRVTGVGAALAHAWLTTELRAYQRPPATTTAHQDCRAAAGARLGRVFAAQFATTCPTPTLPALPARRLPSPRDVPLTGELLALWHNPLAADGASPVVSWLNHCTGLDDIRRVLQQRSTQ